MTFQIFFLTTQVVLLLLLCFSAIQNRRYFLYLTAFLIPLMSLSVDIGVLLTWQRIIFPLAVVAVILEKHRFRIDMRVMGFLLWFLVYATTVTVLSALWDYGTGGRWYRLGQDLGWGSAQSTYRYWVQLATTISVWGAPLIPAWFVRSDKHLVAIINGYVSGNLVSVLVGFYQVFSISLGLPGSDFNWFIGLHKGVFFVQGLSDVFGFQIARLSGLSGEPKHIGSFILSALILILVLELFAPRRFRVQKARSKVVVLAAGTLLTFSTGAWLGALIVIGLLLTWGMLMGRRAAAVSYLFLVGLFGLLLTMALGISKLQSAVEQRLSDRLSEGLVSMVRHEPKDAAFVYYALDNPKELVLGSGAGGLDFRLISYVDELNPVYLEGGGTVTPAYFYTRFLGEFGVVGVLLVLGLIMNWLRVTSNNPEYAWGRVFMITGAIALVTTTSVSLMGYLLVAAAIVVRARKSTSMLAYVFKMSPNLHHQFQTSCAIDTKGDRFR